MSSKVIQSTSPILPVHDIHRAMNYYRLLGFTSEPYQNGDIYAILTREGLDIHLRKAPDLIENHNPCGVYFYLAPGTAAALEAEFRAAGVNILSPLEPREWKMNEFMISDPDHNLLRFGEALAQG
ncbi:MAG: VOC family protein [Granulicella sp.]